jgi:Uma2 family endonuclease
MTTTLLTRTTQDVLNGKPLMFRVSSDTSFRVDSVDSINFNDDSDDDPYIYGYRYESRVLEDGSCEHIQIPLTLEDILHPEEDDHRMHCHKHERGCKYLAYVLEMQLADNPNAVVLADVRIAWNKPHIKPHTPDISVVFNVKQEQNWSTFYEAREGTRPTLVIEITSPATRSTDLVNKLSEYEDAGVAYYMIVDEYKRRGVWKKRLLGYELTATGYQQIEPDKRGWLWLKPVQLWLAWKGDNLVCYNKAGELIPTYTEITHAHEDAQSRAEAETKRADQAEQKVKRDIARDMLSKGLPIDLVTQITGISITEIERTFGRQIT